MAMRPKGGGAGGGSRSRRATRSGVVQSVYEDFKPVSEWQQNDKSHLLNVYLPGFNKDQIKVSTEGRNTIRVRGERLVAGNKWSRFSEDFQVPENGEMDSVRAKFQGGILTLTVGKAKERAAKPEAIDDIPKQPIPQAIPEAKGGKETHSFPADPQTKHGQDGNRKGRDKQSSEERIPEPLKASAESNNNDDPSRRNEEESSEKQRGRSFTPKRGTGNVVSQNDEKNESRDIKASHAVLTKLHEEETTKMRESEKSGEKTAGVSKQQNYKKAVRELNEERQLLVNMGVAMLVIVALTAYVTHSFTSSEFRMHTKSPYLLKHAAEGVQGGDSFENSFFMPLASDSQIIQLPSEH